MPSIMKPGPLESPRLELKFCDFTGGHRIDGGVIGIGKETVISGDKKMATDADGPYDLVSPLTSSDPHNGSAGGLSPRDDQQGQRTSTPSFAAALECRF